MWSPVRPVHCACIRLVSRRFNSDAMKLNVSLTVPWVTLRFTLSSREPREWSPLSVGRTTWRQ
jgi:hypothetical protein